MLVSTVYGADHLLRSVKWCYNSVAQLKESGIPLPSVFLLPFSLSPSCFIVLVPLPCPALSLRDSLPLSGSGPFADWI